METFIQTQKATNKNLTNNPPSEKNPPNNPPSHNKPALQKKSLAGEGNSLQKKSSTGAFTKAKTLETPLQYLKGVGPYLAGIFAKRGIHTLRDLIHWYPRVYRDQRAVRDLSQLEHGMYVTLYGYVVGKKVFKPGGRRAIYEMGIQTEEGGRINCKYFRLPYRGYFDNLPIDQKVKVTGKVTSYRDQLELHHPDIYPFKEEEDTADAVVPIYTEVEKVSQHKIRKIIDTAFSHLLTNKDFLHSDPLPLWLRKENHLIDKATALKQMHQPDQTKVEDYLQFRSPAQKRLIFEEFFLLQLYMGIKQADMKKESAYPIRSTSTLSDKLTKALPFPLTSAQQRVLQEISKDMQQAHPMHRLVQGDVGSGKTIVAFLSACEVIENGFQCALMVPTEILAEQHYKNALALLEPLGVKVSLLTGKTRTKEKRKILEHLRSGYTSLCIGTHALIQESVQFKNLALAVIDEQHRFGVHQRGLLQQKGPRPHFLVMTATPIPRSLAMTLYGDLDVSLVDEMPKGRQSIVTKKAYANQREKVWSFLETQIEQGRQAYVVYPLVEESEHIDLKNAVEEYEKLKQRFPKFSLGLLHGRLSFSEKQEVMSQFVEGNIAILVSTTVIEVGVDVPNANVMVVEHAERFGLSQLHQLRGRVGRGSYKSYCIPVLSGGFSEEAKYRLGIMEQTNDGFKIAEEDLEIRGPGEFLGTRQSGLPEFRVAHLVRDSRLLQQAKEASRKMIQKDPHLNQAEQALLKKEMEKLSDRLLPG